MSGPPGVPAAAYCFPFDSVQENGNKAVMFFFHSDEHPEVAMKGLIYEFWWAIAIFTFVLIYDVAIFVKHFPVRYHGYRFTRPSTFAQRFRNASSQKWEGLLCTALFFIPCIVVAAIYGYATSQPSYWVHFVRTFGPTAVIVAIQYTVGLYEAELEMLRKETFSFKEVVIELLNRAGNADEGLLPA